MQINLQITDVPETCRNSESVPDEEDAIRAELAVITDLVCEYRAASNEIELRHTKAAMRRERLELALVHAKQRKSDTTEESNQNALSTFLEPEQASS